LPRTERLISKAAMREINMLSYETLLGARNFD
jgi:hypothetical protein